VLLENRTPRAGAHWLALALRGPAPHTRAVGARAVVVAGGRTQQRRVRTASSFLSTSTDRLHLGLGPERQAQVTVHWPDGSVQALGRLAADRVHVVRHPALDALPGTAAPP
jgi:hypothetical protein